MLTRRSFLTAAAMGTLSPVAPAWAQNSPAASRPSLGEDGMYNFDWYLESFLDLKEDVTAAKGNNKHLAVMWSQTGCIYCKRLALEYFTDPEIVGFVRKHFDIVHMNLFGDREITDFDGKKLSEKNYARKYGIRLTPTIQFFPDDAANLGAKAPMQREALRMPGLADPKLFLAMFRYVQEKGYRKGSFKDWLKKS